MSDTYSSNITVTTTWQDLATVYTSAAGQQSWVQNKGPGRILVAYSSTATAPTDNIGVIVNGGDLFGGNAAHIWVKALNTPSSVSIGAGAPMNDIGTAGTGITPPAGGGGILGFLSGIFQALVNIGASTTPVSVVASIKNGTWALSSSSNAPSITTLAANQLGYSSAFTPTGETFMVRLSYFQTGGIVPGSDAFWWLEHDPAGGSAFGPVNGSKVMLTDNPLYAINGSKGGSKIFSAHGGTYRIGVCFGAPTGTASGATGFNISYVL